MAKRIQPLRGNVVIERSPAARQTEGGIYVPENAQTLKNQGTVVAVGPGRILDDGRVLDPQCAEADEVVFRDGGIEVEQSGVTYVLIDERMVIGKVVEV